MCETAHKVIIMVCMVTLLGLIMFQVMSALLEIAKTRRDSGERRRAEKKNEIARCCVDSSHGPSWATFNQLNQVYQLNRSLEWVRVTAPFAGSRICCCEDLQELQKESERRSRRGSSCGADRPAEEVSVGAPGPPAGRSEDHRLRRGGGGEKPREARPGMGSGPRFRLDMAVLVIPSSIR